MCSFHFTFTVVVIWNQVIDFIVSFSKQCSLQIFVTLVIVKICHGYNYTDKTAIRKIVINYI